jgi:hypothetical protein
MWRSFIFTLIFTISSLMLAGCGGGGSGSGGDSTGTADSITEAAARIGMDKCVSCHVGGTADGSMQFTEAYQKWLTGPHGNFQYKILKADADAIELADGLPVTSRGEERLYFTYKHFSKWTHDDGNALAFAKFVGYPVLGDLDESCKTCHAPSDLDNQGVAELPTVGKIVSVFAESRRGISPDWDNELLGAANNVAVDWDNDSQKERAVIGCESCHGGASMHQVDPNLLPSFNPDAETCGTCHNSGHAGSLLTDYEASPHAKSLSGNTHISADDDGNANARCSKCHTDEGARKFKDYDAETYTALKTTFEDISNPAYADLSDVSCRTCHDAHNPHEFLESPTVAAGVVTKSAQFNTCTNCHQLTNTAADDTVEPYHHPVTTNHPNANQYGDWHEVIIDTHYDRKDKADNIDWGGNNDYAPEIYGYVIDEDSDDACSACHNPHSSDNTINEQWARSGHGGKILEVKEAALEADASADLQSVAVGEDTAAAWVHYDFKRAGRESCQRCHTSTGFSNFAADPANYDENANTFPAEASQKEMLYCWGCHSDNEGTLRDPGEADASLVELYDATAEGDATRPAQQAVNARIEAAGDLNGSNTCVPCHSGRGTVPAIVENDYNDDNSLDGDSEGSGTHYKATAGTLFRFSAYEMPGLDYENKSYFKHDKIGTVDAEGNEVYEGTGTNGPCATCHMSGNGGHEFEVADSSTETGLPEACNIEACHGGHSVITSEVLEEEKTGFENAITAMKFFIENNYAGAAISMLSGYPYVGYAGNTYSTDFGANDKNAYGAVYNYVYIAHEGGAFAHNRYYAKRVIFDAIDLMDNGTLDGTVDLTGYADAFAWYGGDDITAVERP